VPELEERVEERRLRLERLLQIASQDFELRFDFGARDAVGESQVILGIEPGQAAAAPYAHVKGQALHLLGHYLGETARWGEEARRLEAEARPRFISLWHAMEDARLENGMVRRWPGTLRAFDATLPPNLGGTLTRLMPVNRQVELGLYLDGRGVPGANLIPRVCEALEDAAGPIRRGAQGAAPSDSLAAMQEAYPTVQPLLRGASPADGPAARPEKSLAEAHAGEADDEEPPVIELQDGLVAVAPLGRREELPEWYRPGSLPWFERGLGEKQIHPSALRSDRQTIVEPPRCDPEGYQKLWKEVQRESGFLVSRMLHLLEEQTYLRYSGRYRSGKLEMRKLWKQRLGTYRLFQRQEPRRQRDLACLLLVDESASMQGNDKYRTAAKAAVLLGETLHRLGVPLEIIGFSTAEFEARAAMRLRLTPAHAYRAMRCAALEHRIYKGFNEPFRAARGRLCGIQPRHNNWDEEHLLFAYRRLDRRPERMRLLLVISDGQPNGSAEHAIQAVGQLQKRGCHVVGIGIGQEFVREIYPKAIVVGDFGQLAQEVLQLLTRELQGNGRSAASAAAA
jgi:hypothetical protein